MGIFFQFVFNLTTKYKWLFALLLFVLIGYTGYLASKLRFSEDITKVLPQSEKIDNLNFVFKSVAASNCETIVVCETVNNPATTRVVPNFMSLSQNNPNIFNKKTNYEKPNKETA